MENLPPRHPRAGDLVRLRGAVWRVRRVTPGEGCTAVDVCGSEAGGRLTTRTFLAPFDRPVRFDPNSRLQCVSRRAWMRRLARVSTSAARWDEPLGLAALDADLLPWQLEATLVLLRGATLRVLLADEVGMGKTVQAAFALAALGASGLADRVLVVCPAGLLDQWCDELARRAGLTAALVDLRDLDEHRRALPDGVNPWSLPGAFVVSADLVKRPEHLQALEGTAWDVLVVDEAHAMTTHSDRGRAVAALAARSTRVVLLTATPHDGDDTKFCALLGLGACPVAQPIAIFRRTRADVGIVRTRVWRVLRIRLSPDELRFHAELRRYADAVMSGSRSAELARLAMSVLQKRACSCPTSAGLTLVRRLALLSADDRPAVLQPTLPFDDLASSDEVDDGVLGVEGLSDARRERAWLGRLVELARQAARHERKVEVLLRLLRRLREPAIVFTEYRDTLAHVQRGLPLLDGVVHLHGGLTPEERRAAIAAFVRGQARLLLATDTAAEGLNLHERCRIVVHLEVPWSPRRLEQRLGRVDRLGQTRRVHGLCLVGADTGEVELLARLRKKKDHADEALARLSGGAMEARDGLRARDPGEGSEPRRARKTSAVSTSNRRSQPDVHDAAVRLVEKLEGLRRRAASSEAAAHVSRGLLVARADGRRWPLGDEGWLAIAVTDIETATGTSLEFVTPVWIASQVAVAPTREALRRAAASFIRCSGDAVLARAAHAADAFAACERARLEALSRVEHSRRRFVDTQIRASIVAHAQPGLFDRHGVPASRAAMWRPVTPDHRTGLEIPWFNRSSAPRLIQLLAVVARGR